MDQKWVSITSKAWYITLNPYIATKPEEMTVKYNQKLIKYLRIYRKGKKLDINKIDLMRIIKDKDRYT